MEQAPTAQPNAETANAVTREATRHKESYKADSCMGRYGDSAVVPVTGTGVLGPTAVRRGRRRENSCQCERLAHSRDRTRRRERASHFTGTQYV
ncbi:hypothetical protein NDU88_010436 [Pleurodeles waltl]|uniref:Uncharacterized protein n=1 Tax=Pleurodeles waltl TaxID=8319 RepID=A0AAV7S1D8_PLEWA|nr:hypothetical protein NDU88_010436 [Pleurodeles waltl]